MFDTEAGDAKVEALICLWKINKDGSLAKEMQQNFSINTKYKPSDYKNRMKLTLSNDKQFVLLAVDSEEKIETTLPSEAEIDSEEP